LYKLSKYHDQDGDEKGGVRLTNLVPCCAERWPEDIAEKRPKKSDGTMSVAAGTPPPVCLLVCLGTTAHILCRRDLDGIQEKK
jgi:hypothetical protein